MAVMTSRQFPSWDELYRTDGIERLPWYWPALDADLDRALSHHVIGPCRMLDLGTGPGTQAVALAERGFTVTAVDVSAAAVEYASRKARERNVQATFMQDDVLASRLTGPFDAVFDRGCFHVMPPERRAEYVDTVHRVTRHRGWLFVKTFSHEQPGDTGPYRFRPEDLRAAFGERFEIVDIRDTVFDGQLDPRPKALFATMRRA
jgi:cyclopropane fatty-acyl-phospholipid synthase-like methyltransferase